MAGPRHQLSPDSWAAVSGGRSRCRPKRPGRRSVSSRSRSCLTKCGGAGYPEFMLYKLVLDCRRFSLAILPVLLVAITALTPLAFASPPDPSWVQGIYDDADFDDVVVFIASGAAVVELFLQLDLLLVLPLSVHTAPPEQDAVLSLFRSSLQPRAPPASSVLH